MNRPLTCHRTTFSRFSASHSIPRKRLGSRMRTQLVSKMNFSRARLATHPAVRSARRKSETKWRLSTPAQASFILIATVMTAWASSEKASQAAKARAAQSSSQMSCQYLPFVGRSSDHLMARKTLIKSWLPIQKLSRWPPMPGAKGDLKKWSSQLSKWSNSMI